MTRHMLQMHKNQSAVNHKTNQLKKEKKKKEGGMQDTCAAVGKFGLMLKCALGF